MNKGLFSAFSGKKRDKAGYGQRWQNMLSQRAASTNYTNNTGQPIMVSVSAGGIGSGVLATVDGVTVAINQMGGATSGNWGINFTVPVGGVYNIALTGSFVHWAELR